VIPIRTGTRRALRCWLLLALAIAIASGSGCASTASGPDPWEPMNRKTHVFNDGLDRYLVEPVAKGWDWVVPDPFESALARAFDNLRVPLSLVNNILMLRPRAAGEDIGRFVLNTTWGVAGLFDPASGLDIPDHQSGFGLTLARWYVPPGPYFVLPIFGPSTVRDTVGFAGDIAIYTAAFLPIYATIPMRVVETVNLRSIYLEEVAENRRTSFDYYVFLRNAYLQNRQRRVDLLRPGAKAQADAEDDLYYYEEEEEP
jgi:phospholipid-binding lipoprotein MlaA